MHSYCMYISLTREICPLILHHNEFGSLLCFVRISTLGMKPIYLLGDGAKETNRAGFDIFFKDKEYNVHRNICTSQAEKCFFKT